jgi:hypothetical protein
MEARAEASSALDAGVSILSYVGRGIVVESRLFRQLAFQESGMFTHIALAFERTSVNSLLWQTRSQYTVSLVKTISCTPSSFPKISV